MKKLYASVITLTAALLFSQSASASGWGLFYTEATYPVTATGAKATKDLKYLKKGTAQSKSILGLVELGDAGIDQAARNAGIKQIHFIDIHEKSIFIFFRKLTTNVYGE